jgi:hypothetical protein
MSAPPRRKSHSLVLSPEAAFVEAMEGRCSLRDVLAQIDGHHGTTSACRRHKRRTQVAASKRSEEPVAIRKPNLSTGMTL